MTGSPTEPASPGPSPGGRRARLGGLEVDAARECLLGPDGRAIPLRPKTWEVLGHLMRHPRRVVSRAELLDAVWPEVFVTDDSLTQCVTELRRALGDAAAALLRTVNRRGYILEADGWPGEDAAPPAGTAGPATRPVLAVLPFVNLSGEPRWDRLCDGLVEDMITDFARHPDLRVIARTSSFAWRGRAADIREIGRALGAGYVLEGSVQAEGDRVDVTAQLIEAAGGAHVWASRYTREAEGLFAIQAEVVGRVVGTVAGLAGAISRTELARARRKAPASLHAYELYLLGYEQEARLDREGTLRGIELLEAAVAADPGLSRAWIVLGFALSNAAANGWAEDAGALRARQRAAIRRAVELDPGDAVALEELGAMLARQGDPAGARDAFERAAAAGSNHADALALLGKYMAEVLGHAAAAERMMARAFQLNPFAPPWYFLGATRVAYFAEDFAQAAELALRAPALGLPRLLRALALAQLHRAAEAEAAGEEHAQRFGPGGVATALAGLPPLCPQAQRLLDEGLRKAGIRP
jgi:TolB-like protein